MPGATPRQRKHHVHHFKTMGRVPYEGRGKKKHMKMKTGKKAGKNIWSVNIVDRPKPSLARAAAKCTPKRTSATRSTARSRSYSSSFVQTIPTKPWLRSCTELAFSQLV